MNIKKLNQKIPALLVIVSAIVLITGMFASPQSKQEYGPLLMGGPEGDVLPKIEVECDIPENIPEIESIAVINVSSSKDQILSLANSYTNINLPEKISNRNRGGMVLYDENERLRTMSVNHFMLTKQNITEYENTQSFESAKMVADSFVEELIKDYEPAYTIVYRDTVVGCKTSSNTTVVNHVLNVNYDLGYKGVRIYGNGAEVKVGVCNSEIITLEVHLPLIETEGQMKSISKTPQQAFDEYSQNVKPFLRKEDADKGLSSIARVEEIELCYVYDFLAVDAGPELNLFYLISGYKEVRQDGNLINQEPFSTLVRAE